MAIEPIDLTEARYDLLKLPTKKREVGNIPGLPGAAGTAGNYKAAQYNRLTADWATSILSADQELWSDLRRLRARSRMLAKNNEYAAKFLAQVVKNVIGKPGITFQAKVKKQRGEGLLTQINETLEAAFSDWGKPENCTVDSKQSWKSVQRFFIRQIAMDGEILVRKVPLPGNPYLFALQFIDPDQLDQTFFREGLPGGREIRMGVEVDQYRRPVAYHLWNRHPSEYTSAPNMRIRIPASDILHCFLPLRVGQTRGIPWMTPAMLRMNMLEGYNYSELVAARVAASKMGFFTSESGDAYTGDPDVSGPSLNGQPGAPRMNAEPGAFEALPAGMKFERWDPQHPNAAYGAFVTECLRGIASGLDVAYHELGNDLERINFSSIRAGLLDARDTWGMLQEWMIECFCQPIYEAWLPNAIVGGGLTLDASGLEQYEDSVVWHPRGWDWVDPYKDAMASSLAVQNGFSTITRELAEHGLDFEEIMEERKAELDVISRLGLTIGTDAKGIADTASDDQKDPNDPGDGEKPVKPNGKAKPNGRAHYA